jgi:hypothetical protein
MLESKDTLGTIESGAVCFYFDADTNDAIQRAWAQMAEADISSEMQDAGWRPHVTLSGCRDLRLGEYLPVFQEFAAQIAPMDLPLLNVHERHHAMVIPFCAAVSPYYTPDGWTPHCTLALNLSPETLARAVAMTGRLTPIVSRVEEVGVVRVTRPQVEELAFLPLNRSAIFYHNETQKETAQKIIQEITAKKVYRDPIVTEVVSYQKFYPAEDYHQDYFAQNPLQLYCATVVAPEVRRFQEMNRDRLKP